MKKLRLIKNMLLSSLFALVLYACSDSTSLTAQGTAQGEAACHEKLLHFLPGAKNIQIKSSGKGKRLPYEKIRGVEELYCVTGDFDITSDNPSEGLVHQTRYWFLTRIGNSWECKMGAGRAGTKTYEDLDRHSCPH